MNARHKTTERKANTYLANQATSEGAPKSKGTRARIASVAYSANDYFEATDINGNTEFVHAATVEKWAKS